MIKRIAYLGSSAVCGFGSWVYLCIGVQNKSKGCLATSGNLGLAGLEMGKRDTESNKKESVCACENSNLDDCRSEIK